MSIASSDEGVNVSIMSRNATRLNPLSVTDFRVVDPTWSATIDGPADKPADAIAKLFPDSDDRISDSIVYDPITNTISLEGSDQRRELRHFCGEGVEPFGTEYEDQMVPGVLGPVYTVPVVTPPISPSNTPPITPVTETVEKEIFTTTTTTKTVLAGSPPPSPPKTPIPPPTPPECPPTSPPVIPSAVPPPVSLPESPPISTWASSTSSTSAHRVSPPLSSPIYLPPLTSTDSPITRALVSGDITPPISPVVVSPPTPPGFKAARTSYFTPGSP